MEVRPGRDGETAEERSVEHRHTAMAFWEARVDRREPRSSGELLADGHLWDLLGLVVGSCVIFWAGGLMNLVGYSSLCTEQLGSLF